MIEMNLDRIEKNNICAVIITYNGKQSISNTVEHIRKKVDNIVIVDNYSTDGTREYLDSIKSSNLTVINNNKNYGIAYALNKGFEYANNKGFYWLLTMDQDSVISENMIDEMVKVYSVLPDIEKSKVACLAPKVLYEGKDKITKSTINKLYYEETSVITSGNLVKIFAIKKIGGYEEKLFIDSVDFDFSLRMKERGFKILVCNNSIMFHSLGETRVIKILNKNISFHIHSNIRKYYMSRNHIYIMKKYIINNTWFCIKKSLAFVLFVLQTILFEKDVIYNLKTINEGILDGIKGKLGEKLDIDN